MTGPSSSLMGPVSHLFSLVHLQALPLGSLRASAQHQLHMPHHSNPLPPILPGFADPPSGLPATVPVMTAQQRGQRALAPAPFPSQCTWTTAYTWIIALLQLQDLPPTTPSPLKVDNSPHRSPQLGQPTVLSPSSSSQPVIVCPDPEAMNHWATGDTACQCSSLWCYIPVPVSVSTGILKEQGFLHSLALQPPPKHSAKVGTRQVLTETFGKLFLGHWLCARLSWAPGYSSKQDWPSLL